MEKELCTSRIWSEEATTCPRLVLGLATTLTFSAPIARAARALDSRNPAAPA